MEKFGLTPIYRALHYKYHHSEMLHGDILNKFVNKLFYEYGHDGVLIIDIDCIPLSRKAIDYTFELASNGILVGNAQRSHHIQNNEHSYAASSFVCFSEEVYRELGRPNFLPNKDGDTCEQLTYNAERQGLKRSFYIPTTYDSKNEIGEDWDVDGYKYGIGTTFTNYYGVPMSYHLFGSRLNLWNDLFFKKCEEVLNEDSNLHNM